MKYFEHENATTLAAAQSALNEGAKAIAGGTDLLGALKDKILTDYPEKIVNLKTIAEMNGIEETEAGLRIGANTKLADLAASQLIQKDYTALAQAAHSVASPLIRNQATLGGNLCQDTRCWYYRYPHQIGGRVVCARKGGESCHAVTGEHKYHSIFGGMRVHRTACSEGCPAHVDIPQYLAKVRENDLAGAAEILLKNNPLAAVTARVCSHFCMEGCHRSDYDQEVNIGQIERYVGDYILEHASQLMPAPQEESGKKIAIIGAGPAALSAAYYLRKEGHAVTIYDKMDEPGGLLMYAIPEYRLPKKTVRKLTRAIAAMGVTFKQQVDVGKDIQIDEIIQSFDSIFIDTGAWKRNIIGIDGEELTIFGLEFLIEVKSWMKDKPGSEVIVVGGGNVAVDVAVTAKRLGAKKVTMVSLEDGDELPATKEEMDRALEEEISHFGGWGPKTVLRDNKKVTGIEFKKCLSLRDEAGRFAPEYDETDTKVINGDAILLAVGQQIDLDFLGDQLDLDTERGRIAVAELTQMTSNPGVFAGGDVATGPSTVVSAIAAGHKAADAMIEFLTDEKPEAKMETENFVKRGEDSLSHSQPLSANILPKEQRLADKEDDQGHSFDEIQREANRCLNCSCYAVSASDLATVLMALKAEIITSKRTYPADEFFTAAAKISDVLETAEIVMAVSIKKPHGVTAYDKFRERKAIDFAVVGVASNYQFDGETITDASIVLGAVAPVPVRARAAEEYLIGKTLSEENAQKAAELALKDADPLPQNAYKIQISKTLVKRSMMK